MKPCLVSHSPDHGESAHAMMKAIMRVSTSALLACLATPALADQWLPPQTTVLETADHGARLTIVPRPVSSPLAYFTDKVENREPAGAAPGASAKSAMAILETRDAAGHWTKAWSRPLLNDVAPVETVLANGAQGFVTFDNWHAMGYGPDAIAVYDAQGRLVRNLAVEQVLPPWFVAIQAHSVGSIWWRDTPHLSTDGKSVVVPIALPQPGEELDGPELDLAIRLADGAILGLAELPWQTALGQAAKLAREACGQQLAESAQWNAPIAAPVAGDERAWYSYLREILFRDPKTPIADPDFPDTVVLMPSGGKEQATDRADLEALLTRQRARPGPDVRVIGSPDIAELVAEIDHVAARLRPGGLRGVDLVIVVDASRSERVTHALAASQARLRLVDPNISIAQRTERMVPVGRENFPACAAPAAVGN